MRICVCLNACFAILTGRWVSDPVIIARAGRT
jgi:hypothetical protein